MGSLATHVSAFAFLFPLGVRRLVCSFSFYLKSPSHYRPKTWYFNEPKWKNFDVYILLIALPISAFSEIFWFLTFGGHPVYRFAFFQQAAVLLLFWIIILLVILRESFDFFVVHENVMFFFSGMVFLMEYMIQVDRDSGLSGHTYDLLGNLSLVCSASCLILSLQPIAFFAEVALSCGLVFKGTWILQCGFSLFTSGFMPKGCQRVSELPSYDKSSIKCELEEDGLRGMALIDLLFVGHAIGVMLFSFLLFGYLSFGQNLRYGSGSTESDAMLMRPLPEFEIE